MKLQVPEIFEDIYTILARYYFLKGGRSSGKSWVVADELLMEMVQDQDLSLVCLREVQRSIKHSSKKLLADRIEFHGLHQYFEIQDQQILCRKGRGMMIFQGLQSHTVDSIKSLEGFDRCWVEEAQTISAYSLELLTPTIRKNGAKLFFTYNPKRKDDPVKRLADDMTDKVVIHANYLDNPFCPESIIAEAELMKERRPKQYRHIYLGGYGVAEGLIFEHVTQRAIKEAEIRSLECLQGMDFGYSNDPTAFCENYIDHANKKLYVYEGFYKKKLLNTDIANEIKELKAHKHITRADSAEPKTIATLKGKGIRVIPCEKGKDSIMAGIDYLLEYDIIINAHLKDFYEEAENYTWELDKLTGEPTNKPIDDFNHFWDACRYSVSHLYKRRGKTNGVQKPKGI